MIYRRCLFLGCSAIVISSLNCGSALAADFDQGDLEDVVEKLVKDGSCRLPEVRFETKGNTYEFALECKNVPTEEATPLDYPIALQLMLEALKKERRSLDPIKSKHRIKVKKIIKEQLKLIDEFRGSRKQLNSNLFLLDSQARTIVYDAVEEYAKKKNLVPKRREVPCKALFFTVRVECAPATASIYYMKLLKYKIEAERGKELRRNTLADVRNWNEITNKDREAYLTGKYYFWIVWPNGKKYRSGEVLVKKEEALSFNIKRAR